MPIVTPLTELLGIRHPVLLAPMDTIAGSRLTRAVSEAGGFGILGGGYGDRARLQTEAAELKGFAPFGIGFITWSLAKQPELLDIALAARPQAVMLSFGDPAPFAPQIKASGARLICQVQSEDMAKQALDAGAEILVAQGTEAGGHGASRTTVDIVPAIADLAAGRVPVVAAGGIADGRGLAAMMMLGASGVLVGTRFYASVEANGAAEAKERIRTADGNGNRARRHSRLVAEAVLAGSVHGTHTGQHPYQELDRPRDRADATRRRSRQGVCRGKNRGRFRNRGRVCGRSSRPDP